MAKVKNSVNNEYKIHMHYLSLISYLKKNNYYDPITKKLIRKIPLWMILYHVMLARLATNPKYVFFGSYKRLIKDICEMVPSLSGFLNYDNISKAFKSMEEHGLCTIERENTDGRRRVISFDMVKFIEMSIFHPELNKSKAYRGLSKFCRKFVRRRNVSSKLGAEMLVEDPEELKSVNESLKQHGTYVNTAEQLFNTWIILMQGLHGRKNTLKTYYKKKMPRLENYGKEIHDDSLRKMLKASELSSDDPEDDSSDSSDDLVVVDTPVKAVTKRNYNQKQHIGPRPEWLTQYIENIEEGVDRL